MDQQSQEQEFIKKARHAETMIDSVYLLGSKHDILVDVLNDFKHGESDLKRLQKKSKQSQAEVLSQYPSFDRKQLVISSIIKQELGQNCFPKEYEFQISQERPKNHFISSYKAGEGKPIYLQFIIFYERIENYQLARLLRNKDQLIDNESKEFQPIVVQEQPQITRNSMVSHENSLVFSDMLSIRESEVQRHFVTDKVARLVDVNQNSIVEKSSENASDREFFDIASSKDLTPSPIKSKQIAGSMVQIQSPAPFDQLEDENKRSEVVGLRSAIVLQNTEELDQIDQEIKKVQQLLKQEKLDTLWIPKALCIASKYAFYDYYKTILEHLVYLIQGNKLINVIEAYLFNIVFQIPVPIRNKENVILNIKEEQPIAMSQPNVQELPYSNNSFLEKLLQKISPDDLITIFSVMLSEKKILVIAPEAEILLPIIFGLHSLIYPFKYCILCPYIEEKDLHMINIPMGAFFGIVEKDESKAFEIINDDQENKPSLIVQIQKGDIKFIQNQPINTEQQVKEQKKLSSDQLQNMMQSRYQSFSLQNDERKQGSVQFVSKNSLKVFQDGKAQFLEKKDSNLITAFPKSLRQEIISEMEKAYLKKGDKTDSQSLEMFFLKVREAFFTAVVKLFTPLIGDVESKRKKIFSRERESNKELTIDFKSDEFIKNADTGFKAFYEEIFGIDKNGEGTITTQMFSNLLYQNEQKSENQDERIAIEHFNFCIQRLRGEIQEEDEESKSLKKNKSTQVEKVQKTTLEIAAIRKSYGVDSIFSPIVHETNVEYLIFPQFNQKLFEKDHLLIKDSVDLAITNNKESDDRILKIPQSAREAEIIHICWIYMWCLTLNRQQEKEKYFRLNQLRQVLQKLKADYRMNFKTDLFFLLMDTCYHDGHFRMTSRIYFTMIVFGSLADNRIKLRYFEHQKKEIKDGQKNDKTRKKTVTQQTSNNFLDEHCINLQKSEQQILKPDSKVVQQIFYDYKFKRRTFKSNTEEFSSISNEEDVKLKLQESCSNCHSQLIAPHLKKAVQPLNDAQSAAECTFCGKSINYPRLYITLGKKISRQSGSNVVTETPPFYSCFKVLSMVEQRVRKRDKFELEELRGNNKDETNQLFWNLIYYFNEYELPFDFILPYEKELEEDDVNKYTTRNTETKRNQVVRKQNFE